MKNGTSMKMDVKKHSIGYRFYGAEDNCPFERPLLKKHQLSDKFSYVCVSDNPLISFLVDRLVEDKGHIKGTKLHVVLGNYAGTYGAAIDEMHGQQVVQ